MTNLLIKIFTKKSDSRDSYGNLSSWVGIVTNIFLFILKLMVGLFTSSISIMTDAINNLSDSSASLITLLGFKMSVKPADDEHPYGHARFEYISGLLVACIVFVIGIQFLINSIQKTISPEETSFNLIIAGLLLLSILFKLWQRNFYKKIGEIINSKVLIATSIDSRNDVIITTVVLISNSIESLTGWKLDGPMGILVSLFVIYSGIELLKDTLTPLLGAAPNKRLLDEIHNTILKYPNVIGMHDLIVHNYGPSKLYASAHVEMPANQEILVSHEIIDTIERDINRQLGVSLVIHLDPVITDDIEIKNLKIEVENITKLINDKMSIHDFRLVKGKNYTRIIFDVDVPQNFKKDYEWLRKEYNMKVKEINESYEAVVTVDHNYITNIK